MSRLKKVIRNIIIIVILFFIFLMRSGLYLDSLSAHEHSERSIHYGPSKVAHVEDFDGGKYILGKYDKWVSCDTVNRVMVFFWRFGSQSIGLENHKNKAIDYTWSGGGKDYILYGIINNNKVKRIEITLDNGKVLSQTKFYEKLFLITWKMTSGQTRYFKNIKGYDSDKNVIFQENINS